MSEMLNRWRQITSQNRIPLQASLELTNRCNERCTHCYLPSFTDDAQRVLSFSQWQKILSELREAGSLYLVLMGGEPMLSPHFWSILKEAHSLAFHTSIISNGLKIRNLDMAQRLKSSGLNVATFSFYSLEANVHDSMTRVKGSQQRTQRAIDHCLEAGLQVTVNCLLTRFNISRIFELEDWCLNRGIDLKVDPTITPKLNGNLEPLQFRASQDQLEWFYRTRSERWPHSKPQHSGETLDSPVCNAGKGKCAVTAYGELLPCIEIRQPLGSLIESRFSEIWNNPKGNQWRDFSNRDLQGLEENLGYCDHCPGMALNESGNPLQVSRFTQILAEVKRTSRACQK